MEFPGNLRYTKDHEWIKIEGNTATVGVTDFAQHELGDIVFVDINTVGKTLKENEIFGPVSGTINEINADLEANPENVNSDPYGKGWMMKMTISNPAEADALMDAAAYKQLIGE